MCVDRNAILGNISIISILVTLFTGVTGGPYVFLTLYSVHGTRRVNDSIKITLKRFICQDGE